MNQISIKFKTTDCNGWPKLRFCIDDDVLLEHEFFSDEETISLDLDLIDGPHVLEIERYGKTDANVEFRDNEIKNDQTVELLDLFVDGIWLPDMFKYQGTFFYHDQSVPSGLLWGPNGRWIWNFETPLIKWLVDHKKQVSGNVVDLFVPTKENSSLMLQRLADFERELNAIQT